jgi:hypothetical protein
MGNRIVRGMVLKQPWARLVAEGVFPALVRSIPTDVRERVAVIARGLDPHVIVDHRLPDSTEFPQSAIVGSIRVIGCERVPIRRLTKELEIGFGKEFARFYPQHFLPKRSPAYIWSLDKHHLHKRAIPLQRRNMLFAGRVWQRLDNPPE